MDKETYLYVYRISELGYFSHYVVFTSNKIIETQYHDQLITPLLKSRASYTGFDDFEKTFKQNGYDIRIIEAPGKSLPKKYNHVKQIWNISGNY